MMTSVWLHDRSRCTPGASYQFGKAWFVKCDDRLVIKQFPYSPRQMNVAQGMNSSIQMSDETCLMNVRRKSRI